MDGMMASMDGRMDGVDLTIQQYGRVARREELIDEWIDDVRQVRAVTTCALDSDAASIVQT